MRKIVICIAATIIISSINYGANVVAKEWEWNVEQITDSSYCKSALSVGSNNFAVWEVDIGNNYEIFQYNGLEVTNISNSPYNDRQPIAAVTQVAWLGYDGMGYGKEVFTYDGNFKTQLSNSAYDIGFVNINANGYVTWTDWNEYTRDQIFLNDGISTIQITNNNLENECPDINTSGDITWRAYDGQYTDVMLYRRSSVTPIINHSSVYTGYPKISDNGSVVYGAGGSPLQLYLYDGTSTIAIPNLGPGSDYNPRINAKGEVVWQKDYWNNNGQMAHDIFLYDGNATIQLTNSGSNNSLLGNYKPQINDDGYVVWYGNDGQGNNIYFWDGEQVWQLTNSSSNYDPRIKGNTIFWLGYDGSATQIYKTSLNMVPEPISMFLFGVGGLTLAVSRKLRKKRG